MTDPVKRDTGHTRRHSLALAGAATAGLLAHAGAEPRAARAASNGPYILVDASGGGDYTDIEAAVAAAPAGATLDVRPGTYVVNNGSMQPRAGVAIIGGGYGTLIRARDNLNTTIFEIRSDRVVLQGLRVDGNGANQTPASMNCIYFNSSDGKVLDCFVHDSPGYNIVGFPGASHWVIEGNHSYSTLGSGADVPREGIELQGASYCAVVGNTVRGVGSNGILLWNSTGDCGFNTVTGNTVKDCRGAGIELEDGAHDNTITGNACYHNTWGIFVNDNGSSGAPKANVISGNIAVGSSQNGLQLNTAPLTVVANNVVRGNADNGIGLYGAHDCTVQGNVTSENQHAGILLQDSFDNVCDANVATNNGQDTGWTNRRAGIVLLQNGGACSNNVVSGNRCHDTQSSQTQSYGILVLNKADNNILVGNMIEGNGDNVRALLLNPTDVPTRTQTVPFRRLKVTVGSQKTTIQHGLQYAPQAMTIVMTSPGTIWKAASSSGSFVYLQADGPNRTAEVFVG